MRREDDRLRLRREIRAMEFPTEKLIPREMIKMQAICAQGHEAELGDVPLDEDVRWECPTCQAIQVLPATSTEAPDDVRFITDGDTGSSQEG